MRLRISPARGHKIGLALVGPRARPASPGKFLQQNACKVLTEPNLAAPVGSKRIRLRTCTGTGTVRPKILNELSFGCAKPLRKRVTHACSANLGRCMNIVARDMEQAGHWDQRVADQNGYFERSQMTDLQPQIARHDGGYRSG